MESTTLGILGKYESKSLTKIAAKLKGIPCTLEKTALLNRTTSKKLISEIDGLSCPIHIDALT